MMPEWSKGGAVCDLGHLMGESCTLLCGSVELSELKCCSSFGLAARCSARRLKHIRELYSFQLSDPLSEVPNKEGKSE